MLFRSCVHSTGGHTWYNNTAFQNGSDFNMLSGPSDAPIQLTGTLAHILRNNISYTNKNSNMGGVDTAFNTWDLNITPKATDFLSITDPTVSGTGQAIEASSPALGPRKADGSLPDVDFLKLAGGSQMIDKGTDVGLSFVGAAPDLGAYEYGAAGAGGGGTGGATGAGGTPGTGGSLGTGGVVGSGGRSGTGGATASGGATATGGRSGVGGATIGGATGSGGTLSGGALATGGTTAAGGTPGTGGTTATGGRTGGSGTGGLAGTGGVVATGGSLPATGGIVARGGTTGTGGLPASGGAPGTGGMGTGGTPATGGTSEVVATGGTTSGTGTQASSGGCSCRIAGAPSRGYPALALLGLVMAVLRARRRR